jgi:hypothetical protein
MYRSTRFQPPSNGERKARFCQAFILWRTASSADPFGPPGVFARRFIADDSDKARRLRSEAVEDFRNAQRGKISLFRLMVPFC